MVVAVTVVGMVEVAIDQVIHVIAVGDGLVATRGTVAMAGLMRAAGVIRRAGGGVGGVHCQRMLIDMVAVRRVEMPVVQIVNVIVMDDGRMSAIFAVHVGVVVVDLVVAHASTFILGRAGWGGQVPTRGAGW